MRAEVPFTCHRWVKSGAEGVVSNRPERSASLEVAELDDDDITLLDEVEHPLDYIWEVVVKIRGRGLQNKKRNTHSSRPW